MLVDHPHLSQQHAGLQHSGLQPQQDGNKQAQTQYLNLHTQHVRLTGVKSGDCIVVVKMR